MLLHPVPELKIMQFEGPLDLLYHLIEKNDIDIYDIPIAEITDQYMIFLDDMQSMDMEVASDFLVMAATLVHIKSRMLLPDRRSASAEIEEDPREELVIRLLLYRRCKMLAQDLRELSRKNDGAMLRMPSSPAFLGISVAIPPQEFDPNAFSASVSVVCERDEIRFADLSAKITHILKRDKFSVRDKMKLVWQRIISSGEVFFHEIFPKTDTASIDRVVGFLAVLELLRGNQISAEQDHPFDVIMLSRKKDGDRDKQKLFSDQSSLNLEENKVYD